MGNFKEMVDSINSSEDYKRIIENYFAGEAICEDEKTTLNLMNLEDADFEYFLEIAPDKPEILAIIFGITFLELAAEKNPDRLQRVLSVLFNNPEIREKFNIF